MGGFSFYFWFGFDHILDIAGYDHMLFLIALCAVYTLDQWRQILVLVTAFTIGHSLTLALAALDWISLPSALIEFLIALTIFLTACYNLFFTPEKLTGKRVKGNYLMALFFGLIHGMGFSNQFKALIGSDDSIVSILFPFNLGIEFGQILFVGLILFNAYVIIGKMNVPFRNWKYFLSLFAGNISIYLMITRLPAVFAD